MMADPVEIVAETLYAMEGTENREVPRAVLHDLREEGWRIVRTVDDPDVAALPPTQTWITVEWTPASEGVVAPDDGELPGMWEQADFMGGVDDD